MIMAMNRMGARRALHRSLLGDGLGPGSRAGVLAAVCERLLPLRCPVCAGRAVDCGACLGAELRAEPGLTVATGMAACWSLGAYPAGRPQVLAVKRRGMTGLATVAGGRLAAAWQAGERARVRSGRCPSP